MYSPKHNNMGSNIMVVLENKFCNPNRGLIGIKIGLMIIVFWEFSSGALFFVFMQQFILKRPLPDP